MSILPYKGVFFDQTTRKLAFVKVDGTSTIAVVPDHTPPVPTYEEITVYADVSTEKYCQRNITNHTTAIVDVSTIVALYTDEARTKRFEFDYSSEYEFGYYSSTTGEWVPRSIQSINDMPENTADRGAGESVTCAFLLLDTGELWFVSNNSNTHWAHTNQHAGFYGSAKLRIRKKDQQYYAGYFNTSNTYGNVSFSFHNSRNLYGAPNTGANNIALRSNFDTYLDKTTIGFYNSAGVLVSSGYRNFSWTTSYYTPALEVWYSIHDDGTLNIRMMLFTLSRPTYTGWINTSHSNVSVNSGQNYVFRDDHGEYAMGDPQYLYIPIGIFAANGSSVGTTRPIIDSCSMGVSSTNYLYFTPGRAMTIARILYIKVPSS